MKPVCDISIGEFNVEHVVIDIETLSTKKDALILSIGAVAMEDNGFFCGKFYMPINMQSCIDRNFSVDADTLKWWMGQDKKARNILVKEQENANDIDSALMAFTNWCSGIKEKSTKLHWWGNGSEFDIALLESAFTRCGFSSFPWKHWEVMSMRVISYMNEYLMLDVTREEPDIKHNALSDAEAEALFIRDVLSKLKDKCMKHK